VVIIGFTTPTAVIGGSKWLFFMRILDRNYTFRVVLDNIFAQKEALNPGRKVEGTLPSFLKLSLL
jgi:hypothetical protein